MTKHQHPGPHLDADQLNAFAEGVLPEHERHQALAHLAECTDCRQVVLLAQEPMPIHVPEPVAEPFWRSWFGPLVLAGAAAAVAALVVVSLNLHRASPLPVDNEAANRAPAFQPSAASSVSTPAALPRRRAAEAPPGISPKKSPTAIPAPIQATPNTSPASVPRIEDSGSIADKSALIAQAQARARTSTHESIPAAPVMTAGAGLATPAPTLPPSALDAQRYQQPAHISRNSATAITESKASTDSSGTASASIASNSPAPTAASALKSLNMRIQPDQASSTINGSVTDLTGATIIGATITLRQLPGSATTQTATNAQGQFTIATLPAGRYEIQIASPGFQSLTRQIELKPHDLAQWDSKLTVGAVSEAVTVQAASDQVATQATETNGLIAERDVALPGKRKAVITVTSGATVLALDAAGKLHLKICASRWKTVHAPWPGRVAQLSLAPAAETETSDVSRAAPLPPSAPPSAVFRLTTDSGSVWVSNDGEHWHPL